MGMLTENFDFVIGGDPDRDTVDFAVLDSATGRVHAHLADPPDGAGYRRMFTWAGEHAPGRRVWALEGTGSFAAGLVTFLLDAGEVGALKRTRGAKKRPDRRHPGGSPGAVTRRAGCPSGWRSAGGVTDGFRVQASGSGQPNQSDQRTQEPDRGDANICARNCEAVP